MDACNERWAAALWCRRWPGLPRARWSTTFEMRSPHRHVVGADALALKLLVEAGGVRGDGSLKGGQVLDAAGEHARDGAAPAVPPTDRVRQAPRCKDPRTGLGGGERCLRRSNAPCGAFPRVR